MTNVAGFGNEEEVDGMRLWRGPQGAVLSLTEFPRQELARWQAVGEDAQERWHGNSPNAKKAD